MQRIGQINPSNQSASRAATAIEKKLAGLAGDLIEGQSFEIRLPNGPLLRAGTGELAFCVDVRNERGLSAIKSLDELRIGEAYMNGDIDLEGDLVAALNLRGKFTDRHLLFYLWSIYGQRLLFGR